jgi:hypothetical protein
MPAIESIIAQRMGDAHYYLFVGDSNVERADLPIICGRLPINAGISWATIGTYEHNAKRLADLAKPDFILIPLEATTPCGTISIIFENALRSS